MKKFSFVLVVLVVGLFLLFPSLSFAQKGKKTTAKKTPSNPVKTTALKWKTFTSQDGKFSILMPCTPEVYQFDRDEPYGKATSYTYSCEYESQTVLFGIQANTPYPSMKINDVSEEQKMLLVRNLAIGDNPTIANISKLGILGIKWIAQNPSEDFNGWIIYGKAYHFRSTRRTFVLSYRAKDKATYLKFAADADRFFDSFKAL